MHGNVWEWCLDWYVDSPAGTVDPVRVGFGVEPRVYGRGSWGHYARYCRSAGRFGNNPGFRSNDRGFRLSRILP